MTLFQQVIFHFYDFNQVSLKPKYTQIMHFYPGCKTVIRLSIIPVLAPLSTVCTGFNDCHSNAVIY